MEKKNQYFPQSVPHPGDTLAEKLVEVGMTTTELSKKIGYDWISLVEVIQGKKAIDTYLAVQLEDVFQIPATFWMNAQYNYNQSIHQSTQNSSHGNANGNQG